MFLSILASLVLFLLGQGRINLILLLGISLGIVVLSIIYKKDHNHSSLLIMENLSNNSPLNKIDPLEKIIFAFILIIIIVSSRSITVSITILVSAIIYIIFLNKINFGIFFELMKGPLIFILLSTLGIIISVEKIPTDYLSFRVLGYYLNISNSSQLNGLRLFLISLSSISVLISLAASTPMGDIISGLKRIKLPNIFIEIMYLIFRYIFILSYIYSSMEASSKARLGYSSISTTFRSAKFIASRLFNKSVRMALNSYSAMESRLYSGEIQFLERKYEKLKYLKYMMMYFALIIIVWYLEK